MYLELETNATRTKYQLQHVLPCNAKLYYFVSIWHSELLGDWTLFIVRNSKY
jgi:hypothetical protein